LLPPQKQEIKRIQINHSQPLLLLQPQPLLVPPKIPPPQPPLLPPQQLSKRMIQIQLQHPLPPPKIEELLLQELHPQFVAVKSLIVVPPSFIYTS